MRLKFHKRPRRLRPGEQAFTLSAALVERRDELALTYTLMAQRKLFGRLYRGLQLDYFQKMPPRSGVFLHAIVPSSELTARFTKPGDVDLLVIPYEGHELVMDRCVAIEIKAIRASFVKQGRSPNDFGISQARGLLDMGFPYVAAAHLIVSDQTPIEHWRPMSIAQVIGDNDEVRILPQRLADWMPIDLTLRAYGRLLKAAEDSPDVGIATVFLGTSVDELLGRSDRRQEWFPMCREAPRNPKISEALLSGIGKFFENNYSTFFDNPRYDAS
jgi:hypothetical protein